MVVLVVPEVVLEVVVDVVVIRAHVFESSTHVRLGVAMYLQLPVQFWGVGTGADGLTVVVVEVVVVVDVVGVATISLCWSCSSS